METEAFAKKRVLLFVQGEGRGHLMQVVGLSESLTKSKFEICAIVVGKPKKKTIPSFFRENFSCEIKEMTSPGFISNKNNKGINLRASVINSILHVPTYARNLREIKKIIDNHNPDLILNFFEPLISLYFLFYKKRIPFYCIGHQYIYLHNKFTFPKGQIINRFVIKNYTRLTCVRANKIFALSFYTLTKQNNLIVVPPIVRKEIKNQDSKNENFILVYLSNYGFLKELVEWHNKNSTVLIHCFTDNQKFDFNYQSENFFVHPINDKEFAKKLANCNSLCSTAGFESVCEAMYLGKPVMMIPMHKHFEQYCNARDAFFAGAGIYDAKFNLSKLISFTNTYTKNSLFKIWVDNNEDQILNELLN